MQHQRMFCRRMARGLCANLVGISRVRHVYTELPRKLKKNERKPMVTSVNELKRIARMRKQERDEAREIALKPPENGLLVKELVPVAHDVYSLRAELVTCVSRVIRSISIYACSVCGEVHVGDHPHQIRTCDAPGSPASKQHIWERGGLEHIMPVVESYHLYDRVGRAVSHNERLQVDRVPAVIELCIQAGVDLFEYTTRRRTFPIYSVAGRIIDFERRFPKDDYASEHIDPHDFWVKKKKPDEGLKSVVLHSVDLRGSAIQGIEAWEKLRSGVSKLMQKYPVQTCGFCSEVQVGPKGHRVRNCQAFKHQMRDGQHAWQEATIDDLIPPVYVWHSGDPQAHGPLIDRLKRYYGKLPALVKLFAQAGAEVGEHYAGIMREDVTVPGLDEEKWVV